MYTLMKFFHIKFIFQADIVFAYLGAVLKAFSQPNKHRRHFRIAFKYFFTRLGKKYICLCNGYMVMPNVRKL